jgi:hypothetical protein
MAQELEKEGQSDAGAPSSPREERTERPFDPRALDRLPQPSDQDPPYRPWWVIELRTV